MKTAARAALAILLLLAGWKVFHQLVGLEISRMDPSEAGLREAIRWDPQGPDPYYRLGLLYRDAPEHLDPGAALRHLEEAVRLNPYHWPYRLELAKTYDVEAMPDRAEQSYVQAVELSPRQASYRWLFANFYLRRGNTTSALEQFGSAIRLDPGAYLQPTLGLLWKAGFASGEIESIWPGDKPARLMLLRFWAGQGESAAHLAKNEWERLFREGSEVPAVSEGDFFIRYLMERQEYPEAREAWIRLAGANGVSDGAFARKENWVWNGDFAIQETLGRVLGWHLRKSPAYDVLWGEGEDGIGLRLDFKGVENLNFRGLEQAAIVEPGEYELVFRARSQGITTEQGPYLEAFSGTTAVRTEAILGDRPWQEDSVRFRVEPGQHRVTVRLRRDPSRRIDNKLSGTLWISGVRLERLESR